eukprot:CAMPEP_0168314204 /NCGR_PEP_ID=MMETSP0210-20121227/6753_1 /TAXON_ID=40633 /ORGANISM="Condylostoma magnum, Strain COL2" /LENGTH=62 /DNA_ID=CAMNT_0008279619 /DNA_START=565 /DNA_END=753 /DNA_ORIENTATION=+
MNLREGLGLVAKVICKSMDTTNPSPDKFEIITLVKTGNRTEYKTLTDEEVQHLLDEFDLVQR